MLEWIGQMENSKVVALLLFFSTFCGILIYVYGSRQRRERLESYKYIPFADEDPAAAGPRDSKVQGNEPDQDQ